jgi:hypothetical protein
MLTDDFRYIGRLHAPVPNALGVDDHYGTFIAQSHAPAGGELYIAAEAACLYLAV